MGDKQNLRVRMRLMKLSDDWGVVRREWVNFVVVDIDEWFRCVETFILWKHNHWNYPLTGVSVRFTRTTKHRQNTWSVWCKPRVGGRNRAKKE